MRLKRWCAVLLAALLVALVLMAQPRASAAGANDDVEFIQPPGGENGDPDSGGPNRYFVTRFCSWIAAQSRRLALVRMAPTTRSSAVRVQTSAKQRPAKAAR
jgi:hypothetical protein